MTAATWEQARHFLECDCLDRDAKKCAELVAGIVATCQCPCHRYMNVVLMSEDVTTERPQ